MDIEIKEEFKNITNGLSSLVVLLAKIEESLLEAFGSDTEEYLEDDKK